MNLSRHRLPARAIHHAPAECEVGLGEQPRALEGAALASGVLFPFAPLAGADVERENGEARDVQNLIRGGHAAPSELGKAYHNLFRVGRRPPRIFVINGLAVEETLGTDGGGMDC